MSEAFLPPNIVKELQAINWEALSVEEILALLDKLGLGFYETLRFFIFRLKAGDKDKLMTLVKTSKLGKKQHFQDTLNFVNQIKANPNIPANIKQIMVILVWRSVKKFEQEAYSNFSSLQNPNFSPAF